MDCHRRGGMSSRWLACYWVLISMIYVQVADCGTTSTTVAPTTDPVCGTIRFTAVSGEITSPNYPSDYPNNVYCRYTLVRPYHGLTELKSTRMDLESSSTCGYDYVRIYPGYTPPYSVRKFCGSDSIYQVSNGSVITVDFRTDGSTTKSGFRIVFTSAGPYSTVPPPPTSEPGCGRYYFTENSGVITSPEYPADYPNNIRCIYTIRRPYGTLTLLRSTTFRLESHSSGICRFDYVKIYAGPLSNRYDVIYCGSDTISYTISSDLITIEFRTDASGRYAGFRITFEQAHSSTTATEAHSSTTTPSSIISSTTPTSSASCGRTMFRENSGVINSPNYPGQYPYDVRCFYTIHRYSSAPTLLRSQTFNLEYESSCSYDYVKIYTSSSPGMSSEPFGVYCGSRAINLVLRSRYITVEFRSDGSVPGNGFQLMFGDASASSTTTATTTTTTTTTAGTTTSSTAVCGRTVFRENFGFIHSPNYPGQYPYGVRCVYTIHRYSSAPTLLRSNRFQLEYQSSCSYDYVKIYTGSSSRITSSPVGIYCGTQAINHVLNSRYIIVEFISDGSVTGDGFELQFGDAGANSTTTATSPFRTTGTTTTSGTTTSTTSDCGRTLFRENFGTINSPNFPGRYPNNAYCVYTIHRYSSGSTLLRSYSFDLEDSSTCSYDFVKIYTSSYVTSHPVDVFCGSMSINRVIHSRYITVEFRSDGSTTGFGFQLAYTGANLTTTATTTTTPGTTTSSTSDCGRTLFRTNSGTINSPNFPGRYPNNAHCVYTIYRYSSAPALLRSHSFDLEDSSSCSYDFVKIYASSYVTSHPAHPIGVFCGSMSISRVINSRYITVEFRSDSSSTGFGFQLTFGDVTMSTLTPTTSTSDAQSVSCGGTWNAPTGVIASPNYPVNYYDDSNCVYIIHVYGAKGITLHFDHFELEHGKDCQYDSFKIINGNLRSGRVLRNLCGSRSGEVYHVSNYVTLHFVSDESVTGRGFHITYTVSNHTMTSSSHSAASSHSLTVPLVVVSSLAFVAVVIAVIVGAVVVRRKKRDRRPEPSASFSNPLAQASVNVATDNGHVQPAVQYQHGPATTAVSGVYDYNWSHPPPYAVAPYSAPVEVQPSAPIAPDPNGGYINPVYALSIQNENNDIASPADAGTAAAAPVDTVSGSTPHGTVAGVPPDDGTVAGLAARDAQPQPAVDNCPALVSAGTDDAIVASADDAVFARTDDATVTSTDDSVDANTAEVGEEVKGQDSVA